MIGDLAARYPQVEISWTGVIPGNLALRQLDLCIIAGNLLKNACQAASLAADHQVKAGLKFSGKTMLLTVLNQTDKGVKVGPKGGQYCGKRPDRDWLRQVQILSGALPWPPAVNC